MAEPKKRRKPKQEMTSNVHENAALTAMLNDFVTALDSYAEQPRWKHRLERPFREALGTAYSAAALGRASLGIDGTTQAAQGDAFTEQCMGNSAGRARCLREADRHLVVVTAYVLLAMYGGDGLVEKAEEAVRDLLATSMRGRRRL